MRTHDILSSIVDCFSALYVIAYNVVFYKLKRVFETMSV